jgi:teichuronic acid biosynthesis glycosyltransferase TuaC
MVTGIYPTPQKPHSGTFIQPIVEALRAQGHTVDLVHPGPAPAPLRYIWAVCLVLYKTLRQRYDIVHGHYGLWCLAARLQWRSAVVAAFLGDDLLGTITSEGTLSRKSLLVVCISRWLCRVSHAATVKSEQMRRAAGCNDAVVIPDGVNFALFHPLPRTEARATLGWDQEKYYVLFANNPTIPVKNFALAQQAVQQLAERGIHAELIVANGLPQSTVMLSMNASNALLLPSLVEGAPNVVKEAMACNVPVVATNVGDVAQVIGQTAGCSVCSHDAAELADALAKALRHTGPTTGRRDIAHLESSVVLTQILALYQQAIAKYQCTRRQRERGKEYASS